ncbi:MAG TPA: MOSC domain-containing protein [Pseudonocardiaceae bacterium]
MTGTLVAVCAVHELLDGHSVAGRTAIDKRPLDGPVAVDADGLVVDVQYDRRMHGGVDQAVYAYAREEAERWAAELGEDIPPGRFGENLTVRGMAVTDAVIGERWAVGGTLLEVTLPRTPCRTFASWLGRPDWIHRFGARGDTGCYLRVLTPGTVCAGDTVEVIERPAHGLTAREVFAVTATDPARLRRFLDEAEYVPAKAGARIRRVLEPTTATP